MSATGSYAERPSRLPGAVIWTRDEARSQARNGADPACGVGAVAERPATRVLPDGCLDLLWMAGRLIIAGPDTRGYLVPAVAGARYVGLRLPPGVGPCVFGVPAHELRDRRVPLDDVWPSPVVRELAERVADADDPGAVLEAVALTRLRRAADGGDLRQVRPDPRLAAVVASLRSGSSVAAAAQGAGLGSRQLHRRSLIAFGYGAKTLARILRLNRALELIRAGRPPAAAAADAGYADQSHLAREVKALAGVPLGGLLGGPSGGLLDRSDPQGSGA